MYIIFSLLLRFVWPYLQRNLADRGARYLQERRDRRLKQMVEEKVEEVAPDYLSPAEIRLLKQILEEKVEEAAPDYLSPTKKRHLEQIVEEKAEEVIPDYLPPVEILTGAPRSSANTVWLSLSGVLLGGAFGFIVYLLTRNANSRNLAS